MRFTKGDGIDAVGIQRMAIALTDNGRRQPEERSRKVASEEVLVRALAAPMPVGRAWVVLASAGGVMGRGAGIMRRCVSTRGGRP